MKLPKTARKIKNSHEHWIDCNGDVYAIEHRNGHKRKLYKKIQDTKIGYKYCTIPYFVNGEIVRKNKRVHRLVAEAFIENPKNKPYVCHRNNIKTDNRCDNLYWGTPSENTKQAFDDNLAVNKSGYEDSQSNPVIMYETKTNIELGRFGSISIASKQTGIDKTTISRQCKYHRPVRKQVYFRFDDDESVN